MEESNDNEIAQLLRLKRFEQPPPGYFEDFLHEFHQRQRDELLRQPLWQIAFQRGHDFMMRLNVAQLASYPVAATAVLICAAVMSLRIYQAPAVPKVAALSPAVMTNASAPAASEWNLASTPVSSHMAAMPSRPVFNPHLSTRRKAAPPRYVLDSMPVSYEPTLRF